MNNYYLIIKLKIIFLRLFRFISKPDLLVISKQDYHVKNILLFFPIDEKTFRISIYALRNLLTLNNSSVKLTLIVNTIHKPLIDNNHNEVVGIDWNSKKNRIDNQIIIKQYIDNKNYDMIIDLNTSFYLSIARLLNTIKSNYKLGFISDFSDYFYNIQINIKKNQILERSFKQVERMILK